ncbi:uncharacterized protein LOC123316883 isoform X2 [Coccinella septempunctata]|uniref:uncharacterized protein LOC123316883 isoform X2 n=1 Tax=Coccinella septempunctata TaxID=41139 RepID=UPI001D070BA0|nr:uncharacterized protein LOC123316883 isoform X2 [Coccinella septempunctata]
MLSKLHKRFSLYVISRRMSDKHGPIRNFAFLDLETTGLPSLENNKTKITELSISIVESNHLRMGVFPRVRNKLNLCLNPCKFISPDSTSITGLSNELLERQTPFSLDTVNTINDFLNLQQKPICLVAHNGNGFDYPILRAEIINAKGKISEDILCIDSLSYFKDLHEKQNSTQNVSVTDSGSSLNQEADCQPSKKMKTSQEIPPEFTDDFDNLLCRAMDEYEESIKKQNIQKKNETTPEKQIKSIKYLRINKPKIPRNPRLGDVYKRITSKDPENSHHAEGDVECLMHCAASTGEEFIAWANDNAKLFVDVPPMKPGTKIGV